MSQNKETNTQNATPNNCHTLSIFHTLEENNIEYAYIGHFTSGITDSILSLAELNLQLLNESIKIRKRVYFILVEGLQNITRHQEFSPTHADKSGGLIIQHMDDKFIITTINHIAASEKDNIKQHIDRINNLKEDELKKYYRKVLKQQQISSKGGAGLGLIEIARKSNNKLLYDFEDLDDNYSIFFLQTQISPQNKDDKDTFNTQQNLKLIKQTYNQLVHCSILFSISGIFVQDKIVYMLSLLEKRLKGRATNKNKIFNIIVELLQNIVTHADDYEINNKLGHYGIFYIAEKQDYLIITTGNYVHNSKIDSIRKNLELINGLSIRQLTEKHRNILKYYKSGQHKNNTGLGLINIRMKTREKIYYSFVKIDDQFSFISIEVRLKKESPRTFTLSIKPTDKSPEVELSLNDSKYCFRGKSLVKDAKAFFMPIYNWFNEYKKDPRNLTPIIFDLEEINTATQKAIEKLFEIFDQINKKSIVSIKWYYKSEDSAVYKLGLKLKELFPGIEFKFIKKTD